VQFQKLAGLSFFGTVFVIIFPLPDKSTSIICSNHRNAVLSKISLLFSFPHQGATLMAVLNNQKYSSALFTQGRKQKISLSIIWD